MTDGAQHQTDRGGGQRAEWGYGMSRQTGEQSPRLVGFEASSDDRGGEAAECGNSGERAEMVGDQCQGCEDLLYYGMETFHDWPHEVDVLGAILLTELGCGVCYRPVKGDRSAVAERMGEGERWLHPFDVERDVVEEG